MKLPAEKKPYRKLKWQRVNRGIAVQNQQTMFVTKVKYSNIVHNCFFKVNPFVLFLARSVILWLTNFIFSVQFHHKLGVLIQIYF